MGSPKAWSYCGELMKYDGGTAKNIANSMLFSYHLNGEGRNLSRYTRAFVSKFKPSANEKLEAYARVYEVEKSKKAEANLMSAFRSAGSKASGYGLRTAAGIMFKKSSSAVRRFKGLSLIHI